MSLAEGDSARERGERDLSETESESETVRSTSSRFESRDIGALITG